MWLNLHVLESDLYYQGAIHLAQVHLIISFECAKGSFITSKIFPRNRLSVPGSLKHPSISLSSFRELLLGAGPGDTAVSIYILVLSLFPKFATSFTLFIPSFWSALSRNFRAITPAYSYWEETRWKSSSQTCFCFSCTKHRNKQMGWIKPYLIWLLTFKCQVITSF